MDRAIQCLALEVPEDVWKDVHEKWCAAFEALQAKIDDARSEGYADGRADAAWDAAHG
jgi:hypothetical protein